MIYHDSINVNNLYFMHIIFNIHIQFFPAKIYFFLNNMKLITLVLLILHARGAEESI